MFDFSQTSESISYPIAVVLLSFISIRLLWQRKQCKKFHIFIGVGSTCDIFCILYYSFFMFLTEEAQSFLGETAIRMLLFIDLCFQVVVDLSWFCHVYTAICWKEVLVRHSEFHGFLKYCVYISCTLTVVHLSIIFIHSEITATYAINNLIHVIVFNIWLNASIFSIWITIGYCLFKVLTLPTNKFSKTAVKGYRKVAMGLGIKTMLLSILLVGEILGAIFNLANATEKLEFVTKWYKKLYGWISMAQSLAIIWMLSGLLLKFSFHRQILIVKTSSPRS